MAIGPFLFRQTPTIYFGANRAQTTGTVVSGLGPVALWVHGKNSLSRFGGRETIAKSLTDAGVEFFEWEIAGEPSPADVDRAVKENTGRTISVVISSGGGSVIDAGKAISAMLPLGEPVADYLEDVGTKNHPGVKVPFVAIPTTAGTGSEATKNAVLS